jgi:hypothetical protein
MKISTIGRGRLTLYFDLLLGLLVACLSRRPGCDPPFELTKKIMHA